MTSTTLLTFPITPVPAPRMTRADARFGRRSARPCVLRYWEFQDQLRAMAALLQYTPGDTLSLRFILPMPDSWSLKRKREMDGQPHQSKPDLDNIIKALKDSLLPSDRHVWAYGRMEKVWGIAGAIEVLTDGKDGATP